MLSSEDIIHLKVRIQQVAKICAFNFLLKLADEILGDHGLWRPERFVISLDINLAFNQDKCCMKKICVSPEQFTELKPVVKYPFEYFWERKAFVCINWSIINNIYCIFVNYENLQPVNYFEEELRRFKAVNKLSLSYKTY